VKPVKTWSTPSAAEKARVVPCTLCGGEEFKPALSCEGFGYVRCINCGLAQRNPQPEYSEVRRRYQDLYGGDYLAYELTNEESFLRLQKLALVDAGIDEIKQDLLKIRSPLRVLDIGCATGALLAELRDQGWKTCGVEISTPQVEYARRKRGLDIRKLPLEEIHFPAGEFDLILASHLIEHLNDPASFVKEAFHILAPAGRFIVTTPNIDGLQARLLKGRWRSAIFDHLYLFSIKTLSGLLVKTGFRIEKIVTWGGLAAGLVPCWIKSPADRLAKKAGAGDVMLIRSCKD
jgi:2-polyprenyl-3-methyl-5-hydroxy-6-metoxy-1,4-benzoquinol methylase